MWVPGGIPAKMARKDLPIYGNNGHKPVRFDGDNSYPYNFNKFKMLFGIVDTENDEEETDGN